MQTSKQVLQIKARTALRIRISVSETTCQSDLMCSAIRLQIRELIKTSRSMIGENRQLVTDEPVEFEKYPIEPVEVARLQINHPSFQRNLWIIPQFSKGKTG
jgi:hypothetical protein